MKLRISEEQNSSYTWLGHYILDPYIIILALGAVGNMRHMPLLYSFGYWQVFLINVALQHIWPILITSDVKKIPSSVREVELWQAACTRLHGVAYEHL